MTSRSTVGYILRGPRVSTQTILFVPGIFYENHFSVYIYTVPSQALPNTYPWPSVAHYTWLEPCLTSQPALKLSPRAASSPRAPSCSVAGDVPWRTAVSIVAIAPPPRLLLLLFPLVSLILRNLRDSKSERRYFVGVIGGIITRGGGGGGVKILINSCNAK